jgi:dipeptidyl-peptidase-4
MKKALLIALTLQAVIASPSFGQGTARDYERAETLPQRSARLVYKTSVKPVWIEDSSRFWYRNDLSGGRREFFFVDPTIPVKRPAFDHARLAAAFTKTLGKPVEAGRLPVDYIKFAEEGKPLLLLVGDKTYSLDLQTYGLQESKESLESIKPLILNGPPKPSRSGGEETNLAFLNLTGADVSLFWIDTEGKRQDYGILKPGEKKEQHTYVGHVWLVTTRDGTPLGVYEATNTSALAVISGTANTPPSRPPDAGGAVSPNKQWRISLRNHNAFLRAIPSTIEIPLSQDGTVEDSYQGRVYWSPDSKKVVIFKAVPAQEHKVYEVESSPKDQVQPKLHTMDYLKPGDTIEMRRPHLFDVMSRKEIPIKDDLFPNPWEISEVHWDPDGRRFTFLYNQRGHQAMRLISADADTGETKAVIDEQAKTFIDWTNKVFLDRIDGTHEAVWMSERDGWNHLYLYDTTTGRVKNQITKGPWVVRGVDRVDEVKRQIWFRAGGIRPGQDPYYIHYCRVNFDGSGLTVLTEGDGTHTVQASPDEKYLIDTYSRVDMPPVTELRRASDGGKVLELERADASTLSATGVKLPERFVAKGRDGATDIYGVIFRPTNFDPSKKYPVLEQIYAGPQGSFVPKAFAGFHGPQRFAELGFIVVQIDGMGTNNRSKAFHDVCWKNLADAGFPDRILWMKAAAAKYPSMDLTRVGIYGGSAGGQNALGGMLQHGDFYKDCVADCGCHDNRMDKIWWNEQWMGWPVGPHYAEQSNVTMAPRLRGKLLLMVGELDTNVDPASTMQVVNALIKANKDFDLLVVPGAGHGVAGTPYGRRRLEDFFVKNLLGVEPPNRNDVKQVAGG